MIASYCIFDSHLECQIYTEVRRVLERASLVNNSSLFYCHAFSPCPSGPVPSDSWWPVGNLSPPPRAAYNPINLNHSWPYWVVEAVRLKEFSLSYSFSWMMLLYPFQIKDKILQPSRQKIPLWLGARMPFWVLWCSYDVKTMKEAGWEMATRKERSLIFLLYFLCSSIGFLKSILPPQTTPINFAIQSVILSPQNRDSIIFPQHRQFPADTHH